MLHFTADEKRDMADMYSAGANAYEVGSRFGCSHVTALKVIREIDPTLIRHDGHQKGRPSPRPVRMALPKSIPAPHVAESAFIRPPTKAQLMAGR